MTVSRICKNYFCGFHELCNLTTNDKKTNALALLKIISYATFVIPLIFAAVYGAASFCGRVSKKDDLSSDDKKTTEQFNRRITGGGAGDTASENTENLQNTKNLQFDIEKFKQNVLGNQDIDSSEQSQINSIDEIQLSDYHRQILSESHDLFRSKETGKFEPKDNSLLAEDLRENKLEIVSVGLWLVIAFNDLPGFVFKHSARVVAKKCSYEPYQQKHKEDVYSDRVAKKQHGSSIASRICSGQQLNYLYIPKAKLLNVGEQKQVIVEERFDCPYPTWQEQKEIYRSIQEDPDLNDYADKLLKQLITFTIISGSLNTKYDKIPILPNGRIALHDVEILPYNLESRIWGLYNSCCPGERGIFSHILPNRRQQLKQYALGEAKKYCSQEKVDELKEELEESFYI